MTTLERADPSTFAETEMIPAPVPQSSTAGTPLVTSTKSVTFRPVPSPVLTDIIGYIALGMSELGLNEETIPYSLCKWHVWLTRMNRWMQENESYYPTLLLDKTESELSSDITQVGLTQVGLSQVLPMSLYFSDPVNTAPLGPLTPIDLNTMLSALTRGMKKENKVENEVAASTFGKYINDVNLLAGKIAVQAAGGAENLKEKKDVLSMNDVGRGVANRLKGIGSDINFENDTFPLYMWSGVLFCIFLYFVRMR